MYIGRRQVGCIWQYIVRLAGKKNYPFAFLTHKNKEANKRIIVDDNYAALLYTYRPVEFTKKKNNKAYMKLDEELFNKKNHQVIPTKWKMEYDVRSWWEKSAIIMVILKILYQLSFGLHNNNNSLKLLHFFIHTLLHLEFYFQMIFIIRVGV